ncbi:MAG: hypothetical protein N2Z62_16640 [Rhodobacteraceae bacterium]|nr:hypothetical protein [Paracoccaceae bacterium]
MRLGPAAALAGLLAAACAVPPGEPAAARPADGPLRGAGLTPDPAGLQPHGTPLRIDFGRAQEGVVVAVSRLKDQAPAASMGRPGCAAADTEVVWRDGLALAFRGGTFVGWRDAFGRSAGETCPAA